MLYAADGTINFNIVDGTTWVGAQSADGYWNAVSVDGNSWVGRTNSAGCLNIFIDTDGSGLFGVNHKSGALRVVSGRSTSGAISGSGLDANPGNNLLLESGDLLLLESGDALLLEA